MTPPSRESIPAVITAGGRLDGALASAAKTTLKALAPVVGVSLLSRVVQGLREAGVVRPIIVVGPVADLKAALPDDQDGALLFVEEGKTGPENIQRGLAALGDAAGEGLALLVTCDLPFLDGAAVRWLLDNAPKETDIVFPILTQAEYDAVLPGSPNTYARLGGESYTGSSVFLIRPAALVRNQRLIARVFEARKSQIAMARLLGLPFVLRFLTGRLTVAQAEARASLLTGCRCCALPRAPVALAADVDTLADYEFACQALKARTGKGAVR